MKLLKIINALEEYAPLTYQEEYDNCGLQIGDRNADIQAALCTIDITSEVINEALKLKANLIIAHHPLIFGGLKTITGRSETELMVQKAIKNDIAIYAGHTNFDNIEGGVNDKICAKLGIKNCKPLIKANGALFKLVTFVPHKNVDTVRQAIFEAGAGKIGGYDYCSYNLEGLGSFRGGDQTNPHIGERGKIHFEPEIRIETIVPSALKADVIKALFEAHPYEEVAYDIYPLDNQYEKVGAGKVGFLDQELNADDLLSLVKKVFKSEFIRYSGNTESKIKKLAVCGGSGSFLIKKAINSGAQAFITADLKYHQFFENENKMILIDIGHFESEQFTKEIFYEILSKNFPNFAVHLSGVKTNPIKYFH